MIFIIQAKVQGGFLNGNFGEIFEIRDGFADFKFQHILMDGLPEMGLKFGFGGFHRNIQPLGKLPIGKEFFRVISDDTADLLGNSLPLIPMLQKGAKKQFKIKIRFSLIACQLAFNKLGEDPFDLPMLRSIGQRGDPLFLQGKEAAE